MIESNSSSVLVVGTSNPGKLREIKEVLDGIGFEIRSAVEMGLNHDVDESGKTYRDNAEIKVRYYYGQTGILTLAEDSGIIVDALKGELGVKTRRWGAGHKASDQEWIEYFLNALKDVPAEARTARFVCCAALLGDDGVPRFFEGVTEGVITAGLEAEIYPGIPISACFKPIGYDKVYADLSVEEKNRVSHRGKAMHQIRDCLLLP